MVKATLGEKYTISIKTCFEDCAVSDFLNLKDYSDKEKALSFTDIKPDQYDLLDEYGKESITILLSFIKDYEIINLPEPESKIDVGDESFSKVEQAKQTLSNGKQSLSDFINLAKIYMGKDWIEGRERLVLNVLAQSLQIFQNLEGFLQRHKELNEETKNEDEEAYEEAGIEAIHSYGVFGTIYSICDGKPWLYDQLLSCSAESVYMTLRYAKDKAQFDRNLFKIKSRQQNGNVSGNRK